MGADVGCTALWVLTSEGIAATCGYPMQAVTMGWLPRLVPETSHGNEETAEARPRSRCMRWDSYAISSCVLCMQGAAAAWLPCTRRARSARIRMPPHESKHDQR